MSSLLQHILVDSQANRALLRKCFLTLTRMRIKPSTVDHEVLRHSSRYYSDQSRTRSVSSLLYVSDLDTTHSPTVEIDLNLHDLLQNKAELESNVKERACSFDVEHLVSNFLKRGSVCHVLLHFYYLYPALVSVSPLLKCVCITLLSI